MTCLSDMRQPDINRVNRAKEHLKAATTLLNSIKWENTSLLEGNYMQEAKFKIQGADGYLDSILKLQK